MAFAFEQSSQGTAHCLSNHLNHQPHSLDASRHTSKNTDAVDGIFDMESAFLFSEDIQC